MPWKIFKDDNQWCVHAETPDGGKGERVACHDTEEKAQAQMRALYASEGKAVISYGATDSSANYFYTVTQPGQVYVAPSYTISTGNTTDVPCSDCDDDSAKAGKRLNSAMLNAARDALVTLAKLVKWAGYEDEPSTDEDEDTPEDEAEDAAEEKSATFTVKALTPDRIGGYAVLWGGPDKLDVTGEYFSRDTAELDSIFKAVGKLPQLYHHGADGSLKSDVIGTVDTLKFDDVGVWFEAQLTAANRYKDAVMGLVSRGVLGVSSGTLPRARKVAPDGKIVRWPIAEISLTPSPAEPRMLERPVAAIKAAYVELGLSLPDTADEPDTKALELEREQLALLELTAKGGPGSGNFGHAGRPGDVGGSASGGGMGEGGNIDEEQSVTAFGKKIVVSSAIPNKSAAKDAIRIYSQINDRFPYSELEDQAQRIANGTREYFRGGQVVLSAISNHCRIGRIGFDDKKYKNGVSWAIKLFRDSRAGIPQGLEGVNLTGI